MLFPPLPGCQGQPKKPEVLDFPLENPGGGFSRTSSLVFLHDFNMENPLTYIKLIYIYIYRYINFSSSQGASGVSLYISTPQKNPLSNVKLNSLPPGKLGSPWNLLQGKRLALAGLNLGIYLPGMAVLLGRWLSSNRDWVGWLVGWLMRVAC